MVVIGRVVRERFCQTPVQVHSSPSPPDLGLGLGVDFVFAKNGQSLRNRVAEPAQPVAEPAQPEPPPKSITSRHTRRLRFGMLT